MLRSTCPPTSTFGSATRHHQPQFSRLVAAASLCHQSQDNLALQSSHKANASLGRREALLGALVTGIGLGRTVVPGHVAAKGKEALEPTVINDPAVLKAQLEAQYSQWAAGQFDAWLAGQPESLKWQTTYNGTVMKFKGKAGAQQYFAMLRADLDLQSYKPLAVFVDNDGDEATVVVEASGSSRRTQQLFKTVLLHQYTIGPGAQVLKFKETTDTTLLAQLVPPAPAPAGVAGVPAAVPPAAVDGEAPVQPGPAARSI